jgi:biopolymer transport protein ExbD
MELDMTTFLNLMVVLVPFLLITAVFSRITIVELSLPSSNSTTPVQEPSFRVEVVVRKEGLELTNGSDTIAAIPNVDDEYDLTTLSELLMSLKRTYPDKNDASVLLEPEIPYDYLIQVMDVVRSAELPVEESSDEPDAPQFQRIALFTDIAIGEAP